MHHGLRARVTRVVRRLACWTALQRVAEYVPTFAGVAWVSGDAIDMQRFAVARPEIAHSVEARIDEGDERRGRPVSIGPQNETRRSEGVYGFHRTLHERGYPAR